MLETAAAPAADALRLVWAYIRINTQKSEE